ncbi:sugar transferase [Balneolaceae bacterium YR4-1]|uniref:Sugar transferase n=1 Tax=Halalkalibaculum roseum TaxID=2709311 RepID=A0A6M1SST2_9BACT|nr:sugar transferase [Halalkalibaculum roseum]NGP75930.1 sugar transferase [Halalkalibaculum roseum]
MSTSREAALMDETVSGETFVSVRESITNEFTDQKEANTQFRPAFQTKFESLAAKTYSGKRTIDIIIATFGFLVFAVLYPIIALGIKISSRGPVIYRQKRTGQNGKEFTCYKFRTMHQLSLRRIDGKPVVTQKGDKRIFWFGSLLRKLNLDELPQIINVLEGNMSVVGPRPYPVEECAHWNTTFDDFFYRYAVKPGISGYAQVLGYRGGTLDEEHMRNRLDKDLVYVQKQNMWFDLKIVFLTIKQMLHLETNAH